MRPWLAVIALIAAVAHPAAAADEESPGRHQFEIAFQYLFHPEQKEISGAAALGLTLDL
jgi:hypothetical protein